MYQVLIGPLARFKVKSTEEHRCRFRAPTKTSGNGISCTKLPESQRAAGIFVPAKYDFVRHESCGRFFADRANENRRDVNHGVQISIAAASASGGKVHPRRRDSGSTLYNFTLQDFPRSEASASSTTSSCAMLAAP